MIGALLVVIIVIAIGTRASDGLAVRQQEVILGNLPEREAVAYYEVLRRRVRKINVLRAVALVSILTLFYCYKRHLSHRPAPAQVQPR
jgi:predicted amino acid racemase